MARVRTVDLLPEIFRTDTNKKFLSATLDQLTQEPVFKKTQGFVGRRVGPGVNPNDSYVVEPNAIRADYQLEPGVVFFKPETTTPVDAITYPGMIDALDVSGPIHGVKTDCLKVNIILGTHSAISISFQTTANIIGYRKALIL